MKIILVPIKNFTSSRIHNFFISAINIHFYFNIKVVKKDKKTSNYDDFLNYLNFNIYFSVNDF